MGAAQQMCVNVCVCVCVCVCVYVCVCVCMCHFTYRLICSKLVYGLICGDADVPAKLCS